MNPREKLEEADTATARAFTHMFIECGDQFQFAVDGGVESDEEVRAYLITEDHDHGGKSTIGVTAINEESRFNSVRETLEEMGLEVLEVESSQEHADPIGEYTAYSLVAHAPEGVDGDWNVPHLVVYGSLSPEIEEACYGAFGHEYEYVNIRNHYVVYGEGLTQDDATKLHDTIGRSSQFFDDDKRFAKSQVSGADFI